jgi:hypothetical protein
MRLDCQFAQYFYFAIVIVGKIDTSLVRQSHQCTSRASKLRNAAIDYELESPATVANELIVCLRCMVIRLQLASWKRQSTLA